ncbi:MAG: RNA polymerase sigma factor [Candidatus Promineifilaceae bacterium]|nr:RNA polymerase sigma factor [Candidatus Promineifilaceae bacterium]
MSELRSLTWNDRSPGKFSLDEGSQTLIQRCLQGEEFAYQMLYNQHAGMIYRLAFSLLQNREDAEEVLQDSFDYAFRKLSHFDPNKSAFKTWLYRITVSRCRNKRRRKWLPTFTLNEYPEQNIHDPNSPPLDQIMEMDEQQKLIWQALGKLSLKLRETAILRYYHGLRYHEIGKVLGIPAKTAESRMRLAHKSLREHLEMEDLL